jgi:3-methylcrotonyl-CoA carboxylase alpha subunit
VEPRVIRKILVANRGEIAVRIARTCREMGITSVLAHSAIDARSHALRLFDEAVSLGEGESRVTYLDVGRIIDAARAAGADAIHPGYGFLSERAELAAACEESGIIFIGPSARSIERMGSKADARRLMEGAGVPVVPGYHGEEQSDERLREEARRIGLPLLVKASAGGGGKGMKIVRDFAGLDASIASARREAASAFGNDLLIIERYVDEPRHVEFQIFGDAAGEVIHLFERDCSIQRRHQKIIEESPAPRYGEELRRKMGEAAVAAARQADYRNAGTVEFLLAPDGSFYFLEMNTRLQVEHPVTELVAGVDLVRAQIDTASGRPLPFDASRLTQRGHSIECRVYAEDPDNGFLPQTGIVRHYSEPAGPGVRVDSGIAGGSEVTINYDPLLAKLVVWGSTRLEACSRMERAIAEYEILGVRTNLPYLARIVAHPEFREGNVSTGFIPAHEESLRHQIAPEAGAIAAVLSTAGKRGRPVANRDGAAVLPTVWESVGSWGR